jgi:DNA-binding NarL/FixJ family response regulator
MSIRLVVVDGQTLTRYGLRRLIEDHPDIEVVGECASVAEAPDLVTRARPQVVTVDAAMPDGSGMTLAHELRDRFGSLGIVLLTSQGEDDVLFRALETGVSAFVPKTAPLTEVLAAIRHASVAACSFTAAGLAGALARRRAGDGFSLSQRELQVLRLLHEDLSIPAIARNLYVSQSTAKTYVARLYEKLGACSRSQALMAALQLGLIQHRPSVRPVVVANRPGDAQNSPGRTADVRDRYPA